MFDVRACCRLATPSAAAAVPGHTQTAVPRKEPVSSGRPGCRCWGGTRWASGRRPVASRFSVPYAEAAVNEAKRAILVLLGTSATDRLIRLLLAVRRDTVTWRRGRARCQRRLLDEGRAASGRPAARPDRATARMGRQGGTRESLCHGHVLRSRRTIPCLERRALGSTLWVVVSLLGHPQTGET